MRDLTTTTREALTSAETDAVFLVLLTLNSPQLSTPIRAVKNNEDIDSRGNTFFASDFDINMPKEGENEMPQVELIIENITRQVVQAVRSVSSPCDVTVEVINHQEPDTVVSSVDGLILRDAAYDELTVKGKLMMDDFLNEPMVADRMDSRRFPGLFAV